MYIDLKRQQSDVTFLHAPGGSIVSLEKLHFMKGNTGRGAVHVKNLQSKTMCQGTDWNDAAVIIRSNMQHNPCWSLSGKEREGTSFSNLALYLFKVHTWFLNLETKLTDKQAEPFKSLSQTSHFVQSSKYFFPDSFLSSIDLCPQPLQQRYIF